MQSIAAAVAAGEATEDMMKKYWKAAAKYEAAGGKRDSELNQAMFKAEAAICGVSFDDITQDPLRFDALADLLGCEGLHVIRDPNTLLSLIEAGYTHKKGIMFDGDRILTDESTAMLEEWKIETDESKQKVIPIVLTIGGAMVYAYAVVQSGGAILMFSSTFLPGMAGSIVSAGTYAGGALLITAEGLVTGSRIEEIATGNNSLKNYLDSNPIGGVVDYESLVEAKDLIFVMYLAAGGEAAKFNREYEEMLVASRENSGTAQYGDTMGKMGTYVEKPNVEVDWSLYSEHGTDQMNSRGITKDMVDYYVKNGKALSQNNGNKFAFVTREGVAIVTKEGKLVTTWSSDNFDNSMKEIVRKLFGD